ncbi:sulfate transporter [Bowdeniella nasicola]|uniref:Sulfate transporter n=1 Tax=Bowdeniella nasicola TaxID=208480 RepID=A0A1Q5Q175_9ACTO|nr:sulfate transporter [Bowdeniella nasicola]
MTGFPKLLPGIAIAALAAGIAYAVNFAVPLLSALLVAIILGVILRNTGVIPAAAEPGFAFVGRTVLRLGVVLLGLRLSIPQVLALGWGVIGVIIVTVAATYAVGLLLGRAMKISHATTVLTATGTAICGAAAVAAMSSVVGRGSKDNDTDEAAATAIASVTLFGTVALLALPPLAALLSLAPTETGVWVGAAVHEVGQVVAGAGIAASNVTDSAAASTLVDTAVVTKLGRVAMLAPLVALVGALENRRAERKREEQIAAAEVDDVVAGRPVDHTQVADKRPPIMPLFVAGFLVMVILRSVTNLPGGFLHAADITATILLTCAMVAMGAGVRLKKLVTSGARALGLGAILGVLAVVISLLGVFVLV